MTSTCAVTIRLVASATNVPVPVAVYLYTSYTAPLYAATLMVGLPVVVNERVRSFRALTPSRPDALTVLTLTARSPRTR